MRVITCFALVAALAVGCVVDHAPDPTMTTPMVVEPLACSADISLDGAAHVSGTPIGPLSLDSTGTVICLHLDATQNIQGAHFVAASGNVVGDVSGLATTLQDPDHSMLVDGWDVSFDTASPKTYQNLEWNAPLHEVTDAVLWLRASASPVANVTFEVSLFEPLED
jgi:hypothetical protein